MSGLRATLNVAEEDDMVRKTVTRDQLDEMLADEARSRGMSLDDLRELAESGELQDPYLRDLWIIWGDSPLSNKGGMN